MHLTLSLQSFAKKFNEKSNGGLAKIGTTWRQIKSNGGLAKIGTTWRQIKSIVVSPRIELGSSV